jgi:hypothetical protein
MRHCITIVACFYIGSSTFAQIPLKALSDKKLFNQISFFGGPSICSLRGHLSVSNGPLQRKHVKLGYGVCFGLNHLIHEKTNLESLIFYERKGVIINENVDYWDFNSQSTKNGTLKRDYIYDVYSCSIFINQALSQTPNVDAGVGPFVSYIKKSRMHGELFGAGSSQPIGGYTVDETLYDRKLDAGVSAHVTLKLKITRRISFSLRILDNLGLVNTRSEKGFSPTKTNSLSLFGGITINHIALNDREN